MDLSINISLDISINIGSIEKPIVWQTFTDNSGNDITDNFNNPILVR